MGDFVAVLFTDLAFPTLNGLLCSPLLDKGGCMLYHKHTVIQYLCYKVNMQLYQGKEWQEFASYLQVQW